MKVSGKILPGSVRVSVMAEGQRPRKTKRKREKATPVNAEIQAAVEKERHAQSIARAKRNIEDIAQCNQWDWFATFTVAPDCRELAKYNGDTAGLCIKCLRSIKNKYKATDMKWLLVPEPPEASESKEENPLHVHGLLANVPPQAVHEWKIGEKGCPHSAKAIVMNGRKAAEIPAYSRKYGYNLLESITDLRKLLRYLLKSLDRAQEYRQKGQHLYYASRNVGRPQKLKAVPCTQAMQDKIEALAVDSYRHKQKDGKVVYGKTYVLPDTADGKQRTRSKTWQPPAGMTAKAAEKEAKRQAVIFENEVKQGRAALDARTKLSDVAREYAPECTAG